jgi:hypothetical protein
MMNTLYKKAKESFSPGAEAAFYLKNFTQAQLNWELNRREELTNDKRAKSSRK